MPTNCCRCNASGRCQNCSCNKSNKECSNCLPLRRGHCTNPPKQSSAATPSATTDQVTTEDAQPFSTPVTSEEVHPQLAQITNDEAQPLLTQPTSLEAPVSDGEDSIRGNTSYGNLPSFPPLQANNFRWGNIDEETFAKSVSLSYEEIVHWRWNLFKVPSGKAGKSFVCELGRLFQAYGDGSALESVALADQTSRHPGFLESNNPSASSETVREALQKKHLPPQQLQQTSIITPEEETTEPHPILFERIDGQLIRNTALRIDGAAGPSGLDAAAFKHQCTSFKSESTELCDALASTARRISSSFVGPQRLVCFLLHVDS